MAMANRCHWRLRILIHAALATGLGFFPSWIHAQTEYGVEIKSFGWLGSDAQFIGRYLLDDQDFGSSSGGSFEERVTWEEELIFRTQSYVYHPGFLNIDFNVAPKLVQQDFNSVDGANKSNESFLGFSARLNFLQLKSYPFSLYYRQSSPAVTTGLAGRYISESEEYGANARMRLFKKIVLDLEQTHRDQQGEGFERIENEEVDRSLLRASTKYGDENSLMFNHSYSVRNSLSGSPNLPIQPSIIRQDMSDLTARNYFGSQKHITVNQVFRRLQQELEQTEATETDERNYNAQVRVEHSPKVVSMLNYIASDIARSEGDVKRQNLRVGFDQRFDSSLKYGIVAGYESNRQIGFESDRPGLSGRISYSLPTKFGLFNFNGAAAKTRTDQISSSDQAPVFDEAITLAGTVPVNLAEEFVVAPSVVVSNDSNTQQYVEGSDYRLVVIGTVTSIQRFLGGNIQDGETVLVDYEYQTTGTAKFDLDTYSVGISTNFLKYANANIQYDGSKTSVLDGQLTTPTNDRNTLIFVIGANFPVGQRWKIGGEYRFEDRNEEIAPSASNFTSLQAMTTIAGVANLNLSGSLVKVDQKNSVEDIDQVQLSMGVSGSLYSWVQMSYDLTYLRDTGGSLSRSSLRHSFNLQWTYRSVRLMLRAGYVDESVGETTRDSTHVAATLVRAF